MKNYCRFPGKFSLAVFILELIVLVFFGIFVRYDAVGQPDNNEFESENHVTKFYSMFQDIHIMMFIGFGFLMTFLKRYGYSSVGLNFLVGAFVIQWQTVISGFLNAKWFEDRTIYVNVETITGADFALATNLISMGAVLGKTSPLQLVVMSFFETFAYEANYRLVITYFKATDVGDSMVVHMFGAYFGLMVAWLLGPTEAEKMEEKEGSVYQSDLFSMIGTIFLWICWPSFNASAAVGAGRVRAIVNTYYALAGSCVMTFIMSALVGKKNKFNMVHIQNATLAGGVAVGTIANMNIQPWGAILIGLVAGFVSTLGFEYLTPALKKYLRLHDTCGVHNLHGIPGVISGLGSILAAGVAWDWVYPNSSFGEVFKHTDGYTTQWGAGRQAICLGITLGLAIFSGLITGVILKLPVFDHPTDYDVFDDDKFWLIPVDETVYVSNEDFKKSKHSELTHI